MQHLRGWLLDTYIDGSKAILWIKPECGKAVRLTDKYAPNFYIKPENPLDIERLITTLSTHPNITHIKHEKKYTSLSLERSDVLHVYVDSVQNYKKVLSNLAEVNGIKAYYNVDLLHVQWYLFQKGFPPTSKVSVSYNGNNQLFSLQAIDDSLEVRPPPFTNVIFNIEVSSEKLSPNVNTDPISKIEAFDEDLKPVKTFEGEEEKILSNLSEYIETVDPDFIVADDVEEKLNYILERSRILGLKLQLGREDADISEPKRLLPYCCRGRVPLHLDTFLQIGIAGVVEGSRFTLVPPGLAAKWPAGRTIDSRQCYEALKMGILIPKSNSFFRFVKTAKNVIFSDRGGLILSPKVGLHENVGLLDFESMYPHIIIKYNVSYETTTPDQIRTDREGFLSSLTKTYLERRLYFKHLRKKFRNDSQEWLWCEQRQTALKGILVCIYGYSGCFANRFNNVVCYEEINRIARENLVGSMNIALANSFEVIYADCDSLFVKKEGARKEDFEHLAEKINEETGLPIALDKRFKFLVLMKQEADPNLEATRRYFGKLTNGDLFYRGIELRRHDYPVFLKEFETRLMEILFDAESGDDVWQFQYKKAFDHVVKNCDLIRMGKIPLDELVISKVLRKPVNTYRSLFPHVIAAIQMTQKGKRLKHGEKIDFVYVNAEHANPLRRVVPADILDDRSQHYDRDKYVELVLDVAETVLGPFDFSRKQLGFAAKPKDYIQDLSMERSQEIISELKSLTWES